MNAQASETSCIQIMSRKVYKTSAIATQKLGAPFEQQVLHCQELSRLVRVST